MRNSSFWVAAGLFAGVAAVSVTAAQAAGEASSASKARKAAAGEKGSIAVSVTGLDPNVGTVYIGLYDRSTPFPQEGKHLENKVVRVGGSTAISVKFEGIPQGVYALAAFYDKNGNGKLDYSMGVIPVEPVAFSQGAKIGNFGPPAFDAAAFEVVGAVSQRLSF